MPVPGLVPWFLLSMAAVWGPQEYLGVSLIPRLTLHSLFPPPSSVAARVGCRAGTRNDFPAQLRCSPAVSGAGGCSGSELWSCLTVCLPLPRFAKLLLRLPALRSIGLKCLEHLFFFKLIGDTPIDTFLMEMLEAPHQMT